MCTNVYGFNLTLKIVGKSAGELAMQYFPKIVQPLINGNENPKHNPNAHLKGPQPQRTRKPGKTITV